jgi:Flp pilus assembly protein TadG
MRAPLAGGNGRKAAVMIMFAAGLLTFLSVVALVVDVGYLYAMKSRAQAVADAVALSVARTLDPSKPAANQAGFVKALAQRLLALNGLQSQGYDVSLEEQNGSRPTGSAPREAFTITISGSEAVGAFFSRVLGRSTFVVGVSSRAKLLTGPGGRLEAILMD